MNSRSEYKKGLIAVISAMVIWGVLPGYWQALKPISSWVIILYRILTVFIYSLIVCRFKYSFKRIFEPLKDKSVRLKYFTAGIIVTANWSIFIYAVNSNQVVQSSLGYYIEPIIICIVGNLVFKEKFNKYNVTAILMATASVILMLVHFGELPALALLLATTFAVYTAIKKTVKQPPLISLLYETLILVPPALITIIYLECTGRGAIAVGERSKSFLMLLSGILTLIPLGLFAYAATRCSMFHLGLCEYLSPSISLAMGLLFLGESVDMVQIIGFIIIWVGLAVFSYGEYKVYKNDIKESSDDAAV